MDNSPRKAEASGVNCVLSPAVPDSCSTSGYITKPGTFTLLPENENLSYNNFDNIKFYYFCKLFPFVVFVSKGGSGGAGISPWASGHAR